MTVADSPQQHWRDVRAIPLTPILSAALDAFAEHGYHGTSVRDIAGRVGVTVPALYYHHPNKEGILLSLLGIATDDIGWRVDAAAAEAGAHHVTALQNIVEAIILHMTFRQKLASLDSEARYLSGDNRETYALPRRRIEETLSTVIRAGLEDGVFTTAEPREAARGILGMLQWIARWYRSDGPLTPAEIARRYIALAMSTVGHRG